MTTVDRLVVEIAYNNAQLKRGAVTADNIVSSTSRRMEGNLKNVDVKVNSLNKSFINLGTVISATSAIMAGKSIKDASIEFQNIQVALKAVTGDAKRAAAEYAFLEKETNRLGISTKESALSYAKLLAAAKGNNFEIAKTRELFTAVAEASAIFGLSAQDTGGMIKAFEQILSKGVVSSEELKLQLGDRLPGAMNIAAKAMGVGTAEFVKMLEKGELLSNDFLPKFAKAIRSEFADGIEDATSSARASFERFNNDVFDYLQKLGNETGALDAFADSLETIGDNLDMVSNIAGGVAVIGVAKLTGGLVAYTGTALAATTASTALSTSMAFFGGPIGIAVIALAGGISLVVNELNSANEAHTELNKSIDDVIGLYEKSIELTKEQTKESKEQAKVLREQAGAQKELNKQKINDLITDAKRLQEQAKNRLGKLGTISGTARLGIGVPIESLHAKQTIKNFEAAAREVRHYTNELIDLEKKLKSLDSAEKTAIENLDKKDKQNKKTNKTTKESGVVTIEHKDSINDFIKSLERQLELSKLSDRQRDITIALEKADTLAKKENIKVTDEQIKQIKNAVNAQHDYAESLEEASVETEELTEEFLHLSENIQDATADMLADWELSFDSMTDIAKRAAAEIAAAMIFDPKFRGNVLGGFSGGDSTSNNISNGFGNISSLIGLGGISSGIDGLGASYLGTGFGSDFVGPLLPGQGALTSASLSGILGAAGLGFAGGGILADTLGLKNTGGSVGGGIGAGLGFAFGGPIGGILGSAAGSLIGGQFGATPNQASEFEYNIGNGKTSFGAKGLDQEVGKNVFSQLDSFLTGFESIFKTNIDGEVRGGFNKEVHGGYFVGTGDDSSIFGFDPEDAASVSDAFFDLTEELLKSKEGTEDLLSAFESLDREGKTIAEVMRELSIATGDFAKNFNENIERELKQLEDPEGFAVQQIKDFYDNLRNEVKDIEGINISLIDKIEQLKIDEILGEVVEAQGNLLNFQKEQSSILKLQVNDSSKIASNFRKASSTIRGFLLNDTITNANKFSPTERLSNAQNLFNDLISKAQAGDTNAAEEAVKVAGTLDELLFAQFASTEEYQKGTDLIDNSLSSIADKFDVEANYQQSIADSALRQIELLEQIERNLSIPANDNSPFNLKNNLPASEVLAIKNFLIPDFQAKFGNFDTAVKSGNSAAGSLFNKYVEAAGGNIQKFASGGLVTGGISGVDSVPALVAPKEFVLSAPAVNNIGVGNLNSLNSGGSISVDNSMVVSAINSGSQNTAQGIAALTAVVAMLVDKVDDMQKDIERGVKNPNRAVA